MKRKQYRKKKTTGAAKNKTKMEKKKKKKKQPYTLYSPCIYFLCPAGGAVKPMSL